MKKLFSCLFLIGFVSSRVCDAATCNNDTKNDNRNIDKALQKITQIIKDSCPKNAKPLDCDEVLKNGNTKSGIYTIWSRSRVQECESIRVFCDMETDGGGWTVIQRRGDFQTPDDFFNKNWEKYKNGFGALLKEHWLGNNNIFSITNQGAYSLRIDMRNTKGEEKYALYKSFWIEDEVENYKLRLQGYNGTAGDSISNHDNRAFYTRDRSNNPHGFGNYRREPNSGWWFNVYPSSNLNGLKKTNGQDGIVWSTFGGYHPPLVFTEMKVRSRQN